jgi:hypothetical protein
MSTRGHAAGLGAWAVDKGKTPGGVGNPEEEEKRWVPERN